MVENSTGERKTTWSSWLWSLKGLKTPELNVVFDDILLNETV